MQIINIFYYKFMRRSAKYSLFWTPAVSSLLSFASSYSPSSVLSSISLSISSGNISPASIHKLCKIQHDACIILIVRSTVYE